MSRTGWIRRVAGWPACLALPMGAAISAGLGSPSIAQQLPPAGVVAPAEAPVVAEAGPAAPALPDDVQVVRFQGAPGMNVEVLGPPPEPVTSPDGQGLLTVGLKVGTGYHLRLTGIPDRPGVELFPVVEV